MAALNLVPNPSVLIVQVGVFLVNMAVVKKLFVEPYLVVRERREALTVGSKDEATRALAECETITQAIEARIVATATEAKKERERLRNAALEKRAAVLAAANAETQKTVEAVEQQIRQDLVAERAKVPSIVASLTDEVYKLALA